MVDPAFNSQLHLLFLLKEICCFIDIQENEKIGDII